MGLPEPERGNKILEELKERSRSVKWPGIEKNSLGL